MQGSSLNCSVTGDCGGGWGGELSSYKGLMTLAQGKANAEEMLPRNLSTVIKKIPVLSHEVKGERKLGLKK